MNAAIEHYDRLLAQHYTWMLGGDIHALAAKQASLLTGLGLADPARGTQAVDLGCGPGAQTLALVRLGYGPVIAVDTSRALLDELTRHAPQVPAIRAVCGDLRTVLPMTVEPGTAGAILCMGDTLPHLPDKRDIPTLLGHIADEAEMADHGVLA